MLKAVVSNPSVLDRVSACLPPEWEPGCGPIVDHLYSLKVGGPAGRLRNYTLLYYGLQRLARTMDLDEALDTLEAHLQWQVATNAPHRIFIHAGVVGWRGQAILLPGCCRSGKSVLVTELLKLGATYYSDEYAVLDGRGLVHPYARRLSLRQGEKEANRRCTPEEFGSRIGDRPLPIGLVVATKYRPGSCWRPRVLLRGQAVMQLWDCTLSAERQPEAALHVLDQVAARARCLKSFRGEAVETAELLLEELEHAEAPATGYTLRLVA